jgi:membrane associated rhomboid family serine protease
MDIHLLSYFIGIFIVFASHLAMAVFPKHVNMSTNAHIFGNLFAATLIAYYFMNKEGYIKF